MIDTPLLPLVQMPQALLHPRLLQQRPLRLAVPAHLDRTGMQPYDEATGCLTSKGSGPASS